VLVIENLKLNATQANILLVDDQPQKLLSYEAILGSLGENLLRAGSAREALEILLKQDIAVILVDVVMPEMDGFEFARIVREHPRFQRVPMIFVTAVSTSDAELVKGDALGAVDYVCVPIVPEILRAKVAVFVDLHRKTRALIQLNRTLEQRIADRTREVEQALCIVERNARRLEREMIERQHADESLRQRAEEMETLLETLPIGVFIAHDPECRRITGNRTGHEMLRMAPESNLSKSAPEEERPRHFAICRNGQEIPNVELPVQRAARGTPVRSEELDHVFSDGTIIHSLVSATPLFDREGKTRGAVATIVDITARKQAEQALAPNGNSMFWTSL
jgi:CheY-like chemotaxis protein